MYCGDVVSVGEAGGTRLANVDGEALAGPRPLRFTPGRRRTFWDKNVVALGLSSGFIEPLESTSIHLIYRGMDFFFRLLPDLDCDPNLVDEYNRRKTVEYEEVRDFIILHYALTRRDETAFRAAGPRMGGLWA